MLFEMSAVSQISFVPDFKALADKIYGLTLFVVKRMWNNNSSFTGKPPISDTKIKPVFCFVGAA
jgi:hypothetical protein